jgi:hypothetical protein
MQLHLHLTTLDCIVGVGVCIMLPATHGSISSISPPAVCPCRWDPIFEVTEAVGRGETYAEMDKDVKNGISHRYRSLEKLRAYLMDGHAPAGAAGAAAAGGVAE